MYLKPSLALLIALTGAIAMSYSAASAHMRVPMPHIVAPHIVAPHIVAPRVTPTIPVPPPHFTPRSTVIAKGGFGGSSNNGFGGSSNNNGF